MRTKLLLITLCALSVAACNKPGDPVDKNEIVKDALAVEKKHYSEASAYLESNGYACWRYSEPMEGEYGRFIYCKPKEMAQTSDFLGAMESDVYECIQLFYNEEGIIYQVHAAQQFTSNPTAWEAYRSWVVYLDKLITATTTFYGTIATTSLKKEDGEYIPSTETTDYFDGYENIYLEVQKDAAKNVGHNIGTREDFDRELGALDLNQWARTTVSDKLQMWDDQNVGYNNYLATFKAYSDKAKPALETNKTPLPRAEFDITSGYVLEYY
ncbi:MAG: hypothetical protein IKO66_04870 [Paludibacteraceae bacterium]|nr:hypothetical protein [Paludibacteraceae bacterium]